MSQAENIFLCGKLFALVVCCQCVSVRDVIWETWGRSVCARFGSFDGVCLWKSPSLSLISHQLSVMIFRGSARRLARGDECRCRRFLTRYSVLSSSRDASQARDSSARKMRGRFPHPITSKAGAMGVPVRALAQALRRATPSSG